MRNLLVAMLVSCGFSMLYTYMECCRTVMRLQRVLLFLGCVVSVTALMASWSLSGRYPAGCLLVLSACGYRGDTSIKERAEHSIGAKGIRTSLRTGSLSCCMTTAMPGGAPKKTRRLIDASNLRDTLAANTKQGVLRFNLSREMPSVLAACGVIQVLAGALN